ncbi:amidase [Halomarina ordinaria]|uniref:Amidase n=1 Tax=Halomarina ordinaria TaxID=3033939 RepID=A0ABD5UEW0_9EURY|nr:amidase [Halomarina sp. PSRA2]
MTEDLTFSSATTLARRLRSGDLSASTLVEACLDAIDARNDRTTAFVTARAEAARAAAAEADRAAARGESLGPLHGVPVGIKDLTPVAGVRTTYGSAPLAEHVPDRDDPVVERLRAAGAIVLGKTNTSEFGHVATTDNALFGPTGTPYGPERTAGGSSGGSAAAVADGLVPLAQGTDAGGSVRIPASACGLYGLKPTFGLVPRHTRPDALADVLPFTCTGPLARTVEDAACFLDVTAGPHTADPFSVPAPQGSFVAALDEGVDDLRVAYSPTLDGVFPVDERVETLVDEAVAALADAGATVERADPDLAPLWDDARAGSLTMFQAKVAALVANSEAAFGVDLGDHLEELSGVLAPMVRRGREHDAVSLCAANAARTAVFDAFEAVFAEYDLLACPTLAVPPFPKTEFGPETIAGESVDPYTGWYLTQAFNMTGHPAASLPAGWTDDGLPVGFQLAGPRHAEATLLAASAAYERERPWHDRRPGR